MELLSNSFDFDISKHITDDDYDKPVAFIMTGVMKIHSVPSYKVVHI